MPKTRRDVRDIQASAACELAAQALTLTDDPSMDHVVALSRMRQLIEILESSVTYLLLDQGFSWERIGDQLDGVSRQSYHRRLSKRVAKLIDLPPGIVHYQENRAGREITSELPPCSWTGDLRRIAQLVEGMSTTQHHPQLVKHHRSG
ncbi:hypothetical protein H7J86_05510 [Mycobacterium hackensackense]|uniref:hypothetical protein n=1 Tax=Mycobacterium hackensackense TaxID=228909 RepID=UPI002265BA31|nr:hypothetical protein [Mycobacterium hackensackense]MCV7251613.1 hypothetical protein [Mycobacterium hackensackense]